MSEDLRKRFSNSLALYGLCSFFAFWIFVAMALMEWYDHVLASICFGVMSLLPFFIVGDVISHWLGRR